MRSDQGRPPRQVRPARPLPSGHARGS
jgi:hypothetical protein